LSLPLFKPDAYLVLADDHVTKGSTLLEQKDGIGSTSLRLTRASAATTVKSVPLTIIGLASSDLDDLAVGLGTNSLRDTSSEAVACKSSRKEGRGGSEKSSELHGER
jgi:hypothetical protein